MDFVVEVYPTRRETAFDRNLSVQPVTDAPFFFTPMRPFFDFFGEHWPL